MNNDQRIQHLVTTAKGYGLSLTRYKNGAYEFRKVEDSSRACWVYGLVYAEQFLRGYSFAKFHDVFVPRVEVESGYVDLITQELDGDIIEDIDPPKGEWR